MHAWHTHWVRAVCHDRLDRGGSWAGGRRVGRTASAGSAGCGAARLEEDLLDVVRVRPDERGPGVSCRVWRTVVRVAGRRCDPTSDASCVLSGLADVVRIARRRCDPTRCGRACLGGLADVVRIARRSVRPGEVAPCASCRAPASSPAPQGGDAARLTGGGAGRCRLRRRRGSTPPLRPATQPVARTPASAAWPARARNATAQAPSAGQLRPHRRPQSRRPQSRRPSPAAARSPRRRTRPRRRCPPPHPRDPSRRRPRRRPSASRPQQLPTPPPPRPSSGSNRTGPDATRRTGSR